jgi:citrate lyase beta subunit
MERRQFNKYFLTSGLYVPGNQQKMLTKCVTTQAALLVPDMEDSVPEGEEKQRARDLIRENITSIRAKAHRERVVITPRTNGLTTGLFEGDVQGVLTKETAVAIDGFCVPKVDTLTDYEVIDAYLMG